MLFSLSNLKASYRFCNCCKLLLLPLLLPHLCFLLMLLPWHCFGPRDFVAVITGPKNPHPSPSPRRTLCLYEVRARAGAGIWDGIWGAREKKANWVEAGPLMLSQFVRICCCSHTKTEVAHGTGAAIFCVIDRDGFVLICGDFLFGAC